MRIGTGWTAPCARALYRYLGLGANDMSTFAGLGNGAMESVVLYPIILWLIGYGYR
jgi:hypothetical protein